MKTLKMLSMATFCLIMIAAALAVMADPAYSGPPHASPFDDSSGSMPPGYGNTTIQKAQEAAKTAVQVSVSSKIDMTITEPSVATTPVMKPGIDTNALAIPLSSASKAHFINSPLGSAFSNKDDAEMNLLNGKKEASLKKTLVVTPNTAIMSSVPVINSKETSDVQEAIFKPITNEYASSKEEMEMANGLKAIINDLKKSDGSSDNSKAKELQDQLTKIADMMNSSQYNLNAPGRDTRYASGAYLFKELNNKKTMLVMKYDKATEPYYDGVRSILIKNIRVIQAISGSAKRVTEEDIKKMPRNEIDKLLEKLRKSSDKTFEMEYILQEEAKYQKKYLEPNLKKFTSDMIEAISGFTEKMSEVVK